MTWRCPGPRVARSRSSCIRRPRPPPAGSTRWIRITSSTRSPRARSGCDLVDAAVADVGAAAANHGLYFRGRLAAERAEGPLCVGGRALLAHAMSHDRRPISFFALDNPDAKGVPERQFVRTPRAVDRLAVAVRQ